MGSEVGDDGAPDGDAGGLVERLTDRSEVLLLCAVGYGATVIGFVFCFLFLNRVISLLFLAVQPSVSTEPATASLLFYGPRVLAAVALVVGLVGTDIAVTRRLADSPRTNVGATIGWVAFATALAGLPVALVAAGGAGAFLFPLALLEEPLVALVVLIPLGVLAVGGGSLCFYAPIGVAVEGRSLRASLGVGCSRVRARPLVAVRALAALVTGWLLGGVLLLVGLLVLLVAVATLWVGVGLLVLPIGLAVCMLAVLPLTGGHVYYRLATLRA